MNFSGMIKSFVLIFILAATVASGATIGIITDGNSVYWKALQQAAQTTASKTGVDLLFLSPAPSTVAQQQELVNELLTQNVHALALCPIKAGEQSAFLSELAGKTKLCTLLVDAPDSGRRIFFGRDEKRIGEMLAELLPECVPMGLKIMPFCKDPEDKAGKTRLESFIARAGEDYFLEPTFADSGDRMLAQSTLEDLLVKRPEIAAYIGLESYHAGLMVHAVVGKGRARMVRLLGVDSGPVSLQALQEGIIHGLVIDDAEQAGPLIVNALKALAEEDQAFELPEDNCIMLPSIQLETAKSLNTQEMMDAIRVQVPWLSESAPGTP